MPTPPSQLPTATLLAATGGLLDAVVYLGHGHVFANAMTGNVILLGISAVTQDWRQVLRHLVPLLAFLSGVLAARRLADVQIRALPAHRGALFTLAVEALTLAILGTLSNSLPELAFTGTISFVSAFQVTTFRKVGRFTYNSTFVTGNLREVAEGFYDHLFAPDPALRYLGSRKFRKLGLICAAFLAGALLGAWAQRHFPSHAIWFAEPLLLAVLILTLWKPVKPKIA